MRISPKVPATSARAVPDGDTRDRRWRFFERIFVLLCLAIATDLVTTYLGFRRIGARFEQNGLALYIIQHGGWPGLVLVLAAACFACLRSFRLVYWRLGLGWSRWLNVVVAVVCAVRWVVALSNVVWLVHP